MSRDDWTPKFAYIIDITTILVGSDHPDTSQKIPSSADSRESYPVGPDQQGILVYSADGYVSVNLSPAQRPALGAASFPQAEDARLAAVCRDYMAYAGPFHVDEERQRVHHDFQLCLNPDAVGTPQVREARFVGEHLELSVPATMLGGKMRSVHLEWRRP